MKTIERTKHSTYAYESMKMCGVQTMASSSTS